MGSQLDLDQGGTYRSWVRQYLGPSVGWVYGPADSIFSITAAGTYTVTRNVSLINVSVNASVTINLPTVVTAVPAIVMPYIANSITVVDVGGFATAFPITIQAFVGENIGGASSVQITTNFGSITLLPNNQSGWDRI